MVSAPRHNSNRKSSIKQLLPFSALLVNNSHTLFSNNVFEFQILVPKICKTLKKKALAFNFCFKLFINV